MSTYSGQKVYVVAWHEAYQGAEMEAVFSSLTKAKEFIDKKKLIYGWSGYATHEYTIDCPNVDVITYWDDDDYPL